MKTVYLDNHILIKLVEQPNDVLISKVAEILNSKTTRFAASLWNIYEIVNSPSDDQAIELGRYLDKLKPLWLISSDVIRCMEVKRFIFEHFYEEHHESIKPFCEYLSQIFTYYPASSYSIGDTATSIIKCLLKSPAALNEARQYLDTIPSQTQVLANAKKTSTFEKECFINLVQCSLPTKDPSGLLIDNKANSEILNFCYQHRKDFYKYCRTFNVENYLYTFRTSDKKRIVKKQDAADLQHQLPALSYCDYFITEDGFILSGVQYIRKHIPIANTIKTLLDIDLLDK